MVTKDFSCYDSFHLMKREAIYKPKTNKSLVRVVLNPVSLSKVSDSNLVDKKNVVGKEEPH